MQLAGLLAEGVDPATFFGAVIEVELGGGGGAAGRERRGADAAFAGARWPATPPRGYSRGTLTDLVAGGRGRDG